MFTAPVGLPDERSIASTEDTGEHIAIGEQAVPVEEAKPEAVVKRPTRKKAAPAGKAARRRTPRK